MEGPIGFKLADISLFFTRTKDFFYAGDARSKVGLKPSIGNLIPACIALYTNTCMAWNAAHCNCFQNTGFGSENRRQKKWAFVKQS